MRKSTLITTIAMIVVVVVALSTATFAWFSSSTANSAQQTITVTGAGDWLLQSGVVSDGDTQITWSTASTEITIDSAFDGVWAPTVALNAQITDPTDTSTSALTQGLGTVNDSTLLANLGIENTVINQTGRQIFVKANAVGAANNCAGAMAKAPTLLRVTNTQQATSNLYLFVIVKLGNNPTTATKRAGAAMTFNLETISGTNTRSTHTNGYTTIATDCAAAGAKWAPSDETTKYAITKGATVSATGVTAGIRPDYATAATASNFGTPVTSGNSSIGTATGETIIYYKLSLGSLTKDASMSMALYSWMDGWTADDYARGSEKIKVVYAFTKDNINPATGALQS